MRQVAAAALLLGCARPAPPPERLPAAGSPGDDGRGLLATMSRGPASARELPGGDVGSRPAPREPAVRPPYRFDPTVVPHPVPAPYGDGYTIVEVERGGWIVGDVVGVPDAPADAPGCRAVGGAAVVYLDGVTRGRGPLGSGPQARSRLQLGGALELGGCGLAPRVQLVAPIGGSVKIANLDSLAHALRAAPVEGGDGAFRLELSPGSEAERTLDRPGWLRVVRDDVPADEAWILVEPHPYAAVIDRDGGFRLDDVVPGRYQLVVWTPPTTPGGAPTIRRQSIEVRGGRATRVTVRLSPSR